MEICKLVNCGPYNMTYQSYKFWTIHKIVVNGVNNKLRKCSDVH